MMEYGGYEEEDRMGPYRRDSFGRDERRVRRRDEPDDFEPRKRRRSPSPYGSGPRDFGRRGEYDFPPPGPRSRFDNRRSMIPDPYKLEYLAPFPLFAEYSRHQEMKRHGRSNLSNEEIERRYDAYKDTFIRRLQVKFFETNKEEEWFREKYHPQDSIQLKEETTKRRQELLAQYVTEFESGKFDEVCFDGVDTSSTSKPSESEQNGEIKDHDDDDHPADPEVEEAVDPNAVAESKAMIPPDSLHAIFIRNVSFGLKRADLLNIVKDIQGFKYLVLTDPRPDKKNNRLGWFVFDTSVNLDEMCLKLNETKVGDVTLYLSKHASAPSRIRLIPPDFSRASRLLHDLNQVRRLATCLDQEAGFAQDRGFALVERRLDTIHGPFESHTQPPADTNEEQKEENGEDDDPNINVTAVKKRLDAIIVYLRKVHNYDYYFGTESSSPEDFVRRAHICVRKPLSEYRPRDPNSRKETFMDRLDSRVALRIEKPTSGSLVVKRGGKDLDKALEDEMHEHVLREAETKYRCQICSKLFKGEEYVLKHIRGKHSEFVEKMTAGILYYNAYALDQNKVDPLKTAPLPPPPMMMGGPMMIPPPFMGMMSGPMYGMPMRPPPPMAWGSPDRAYGQYSQRNGSMTDSSPTQPRPPPPNARRDPRQLKSYHDLDAPAGGEIELKYD